MATASVVDDDAGVDNVSTMDSGPKATHRRPQQRQGLSERERAGNRSREKTQQNANDENKRQGGRNRNKDRNGEMKEL